jgi:phenylacetate-CoA ligase
MTVTSLAPHFQIELNRVGHKDEMRVRVEPVEGAIELGESAAKELAVKIKQVVGVTVKIDVTNPGGVARSEGKAVRIVDNRPKDK